MAGANDAEDKLRDVFPSAQAIKADIYLLLRNDVSARRIWGMRYSRRVRASKIATVANGGGGPGPGGEVSSLCHSDGHIVEDRFCHQDA